jgi:hypothetical protein
MRFSFLWLRFGLLLAFSSCTKARAPLESSPLPSAEQELPRSQALQTIALVTSPEPNKKEAPATGEVPAAPVLPTRQSDPPAVPPVDFRAPPVLKV